MLALCIDGGVVEVNHAVEVGGGFNSQLAVDFCHDRVAGLLERHDAEHIPIGIEIVAEYVDDDGLVFRHFGGISHRQRRVVHRQDGDLDRCRGSLALLVDERVVEVDHPVEIGDRCNMQLAIDFGHHRVARLLERLDALEVSIDDRVVAEDVDRDGLIFGHLDRIVDRQRSIIRWQYGYLDRRRGL